MIEMVTVIPFGVFETYLLYPPHKKVLNLPSRYILFYGAILPYKGLDVLYDAIAILGNRVGSLKIVVAGRGDDPVLKKIQRDERFIVVNRLLSNQEIVELNMGAYCVVCPYRSASQSGIVSTSFLFSVPIIASDVGGFTEYVVNHQNGLLVEPSNPKALSEAIATVLSDKALHTTLQQGAAAFEHATQFSWRGISKRYLDLFRQKTYKSKATLNGVEP
jgi:glycosyltransferase involved in cell wall biosynthesis